MSQVVLRRMRTSHFGVALLCCLVFTGIVQANVLVPPATNTPDIFSLVCPGGTCLTGTGATQVTPITVSTNGKVTFTLRSGVFSDPNNFFGAGLLTFVYQVTNLGTGTQDPINRVTGIDFTGFSTDVGYASNGSVLANGFVNGTVSPELVDRLTPGTVGFGFTAPLLQPIGLGQTSSVLIIQTNASKFTSGFANIIDGGVSTVAAYQPTAGVPEPASIALFGAGLVALAGIRRFRRHS